MAFVAETNEFGRYCVWALGEVSVKEQVRSVLHYKKAAVWLLAAAIAACVIVGVCFLTNPPSTALR